MPNNNLIKDALFGGFGCNQPNDKSIKEYSKSKNTNAKNSFAIVLAEKISIALIILRDCIEILWNNAAVFDRKVFIYCCVV